MARNMPVQKRNVLLENNMVNKETRVSLAPVLQVMSLVYVGCENVSLSKMHTSFLASSYSSMKPPFPL